MLKAAAHKATGLIPVVDFLLSLLALFFSVSCLIWREVEIIFSLLLHYSFLIYFVAGPKTVKFIPRDFVELHCIGAFLVELQWFGNSGQV